MERFYRVGLLASRRVLFYKKSLLSSSSDKARYYWATDSEPQNPKISGPCVHPIRASNLRAQQNDGNCPLVRAAARETQQRAQSKSLKTVSRTPVTGPVGHRTAEQRCARRRPAATTTRRASYGRRSTAPTAWSTRRASYGRSTAPTAWPTRVTPPPASPIHRFTVAQDAMMELSESTGSCSLRRGERVSPG